MNNVIMEIIFQKKIYNIYMTKTTSFVIVVWNLLGLIFYS